MLRISLLVLFCSGATATLVTFKDGSYTDVIVAFYGGHLLRDEDELVNNFTKLMKDASRVLHVATQGLAYFKEVRIILTRSDWFRKDDPDRIAERSSIFPRADIRIGSPNVEYGTPDMFAVQTGQCGEPGKFIFLSDSFIRDLSENTMELAARHLVQEWVRYRYGVFSELPIWGEELFRWEGNQTSPATCADGIRGWAMTEGHERCVMECGRVRSNCRFFPDPESNSGVESSLMLYPHIPDVKHFCNSSTHNRKAPSKQNRMCNSKSIMEVIRKHEDFFNAHRNKDTRKKVSQLETKFSQMYDVDVHLDIVFIFELSEWMEKENGVQEVQDFVKRFIVHLAPREAGIWFIKFSDKTEKVWDRMKAGDSSGWKKVDILNVSRPVGNPSAPPDIDKALRYAYNKAPGGSAMWLPVFILISTGDGKVDEVEQYKSWEKREIPTIHSIIIGRNVSWKLDSLSQMNGGDSYFVGDAESRGREPRTFNLDMAVLASMHSTAEDNDHPVVILYERFTLKSKRKDYEYYFQVDSGIGRDLLLTFSPNYTTHKLFNPHLLRENGHPYPSYPFKSIAKSIFVNFAEPGRWTLQLNRGSRQEDYVDVMITARPRTRCSLQCSCVLVRAWITNVMEVKKGHGTIGCHCIYAEVKNGYQPVIEATVEATVQILGQKNPIKVMLRDNGGAPDVFKHDGIYSNFFPVTNRTAGRPIVIVRVKNSDGKARMKVASCKKSTHGMLDAGDRQRAANEFGDSKSWFSTKDFRKYARTKAYCKQRKETEQICSAVALPLFERVAMANSPVLSPMSETEVLKTPPAPVQDLKVVQEFKRGNAFFVLLQWTSPEHPRPDMKVETVEVCVWRNPNFVTSKECPSENIISTFKNIAPPGEVRQSEVKIPESMLKDSEGKIHNLYLALRAKDVGGNQGEMSKVAEALFDRSDLEEEVVKEVEEEAGNHSWLPWTIMAAVAIMAVMAAVAGTIGYFKWKEKKEGHQKDSSAEQQQPRWRFWFTRC